MGVEPSAAPSSNHPETPSCPKRLSTPGCPTKSSKPNEAELDLAADFSGDAGPALEEAIRQALPTPRQASTLQRPVTPSWLDPPWPRQEVPFQSWSRPGTASTVCDE